MLEKGKELLWIFTAFLELYHDYLLIYLFCPPASEPLEFGDKDLVIFIFAILNTTSQSLPQPGRDLIVKIIYS